MVAGGDLARVAKGAGIVAKALLQAEGPVAARQALQWKQHGSGLASSLKNVRGYALFSVDLCHQASRIAAAERSLYCIVCYCYSRTPFRNSPSHAGPDSSHAGADSRCKNDTKLHSTAVH